MKMQHLVGMIKHFGVFHLTVTYQYLSCVSFLSKTADDATNYLFSDQTTDTKTDTKNVVNDPKRQGSVGVYAWVCYVPGM